MWALKSWKEARVKQSWFVEAKPRSNIASHPEVWILQNCLTIIVDTSSCLLYLIYSTRYKTLNIFIFSKNLRKCCAKGRSCLYSWKAHFAYAIIINVTELTRVIPMQSVSTNPNIPFAWLHVTHFCILNTFR